MATENRGEGNILLTPSIIAKESLMRLMNSLVIPRLASFTFEKYFSNAIGDTITVRLPYYAFISKGRELQPADINAMIDRSTTIKVGDRWKFPLRWNDEEKTLHINDFSARYLDSGIEQLAYQYDMDGADALVYDSHIHQGTPGTEFTQDVVPFIRAHAEEVAIPADMSNFGLINPYDSATLTKDLGGAKGESGKFAENIVRSAIERRFIGELSEYRMFRTIHMPVIEVPRHANHGTPLTNLAADQGTGSEITTDSWGNTARKVLNKGQLFTIAGVYEVYPRSYDGEGANRTKRRTGRLKTFTVTEDINCSAAGAATIKFSPALNDGSATQADPGGGADISLKAFQNVSAAVADGAAINVLGLPATAKTERYRQNMFFHRKALQYVPIILSTSKSAVRQYREMHEGTNLNLLVTQFFDGNKMEETLRVDGYWVAANVYPELGIRQYSSREAA